MEIAYHKDVGEFILSLRKPEKGKVVRIISLLETYGNTLRMPHSKPLGKGLFELGVRGYEVRILYTYKDGKAILLHVFIKNTANIPRSEITQARRKMRLT